MKQEADEEGSGRRRKRSKGLEDAGSGWGRDRMEWEQTKYETGEARSEWNRKRAKQDAGNRKRELEEVEISRSRNQTAINQEVNGAGRGRSRKS